MNQKDKRVSLSSNISEPTASARRSFIGKLTALAAALIPISAAHAAAKDRSAGSGSSVEEQLAEFNNRIGMLEDTAAIRNLQHAYGYYLDKCLYEEVVDLYAEDSKVIFNGGIYHGKKGVHRLYVELFQNTFTNGYNGPLPGFLLDHPQLQDVITVAPDRMTAKGRFRTLMQAGVHETSKAPMAENARKEGRPLNQWWEGGMYENTYARENGVWKILVLNYQPIWHADYETGWAHTRVPYVPPFSETYPENPTGPDELDADYPGLWPNTEVVAFHYPHPVTGKPWKMAPR